MFDVRDSLELRVNNNKNVINNKIGFDKVNRKLNNYAQTLINLKNIINNSSLNNFNYENDIQKNETNLYQKSYIFNAIFFELLIISHLIFQQFLIYYNFYL